MRVPSALSSPDTRTPRALAIYALSVNGCLNEGTPLISLIDEKGAPRRRQPEGEEPVSGIRNFDVHAKCAESCGLIT